MSNNNLSDEPIDMFDRLISSARFYQETEPEKALLLTIGIAHDMRDRLSALEKEDQS